MTSPALVLLDLDRTVIFSSDAAAPVEQPRCVEVKDGRMISFMTARAYDYLNELRAVATVVPVTTRTSAQLSRVSLFDPATTPWAVCANGGQIMRHGAVDAGWEQAARLLIANSGFTADDARRMLSVAVAATRVCDGDGLLSYAVPSEPVAGDVVAALQARLAQHRWRVSLQGRKLYALPIGIDKATAADHVSRWLCPTAIAAAGDSSLDIGMLRLADYAICPAGSEASSSVARVTSASGLHGGEEILLRLLTWAHGAIST